MNDQVVEQNLQYFRDRVSVKGNTTQARAKNILDRWEKVVEDCQKSNDHSTYRILFSNIHTEAAVALRRLLERNLNEEEILSHIRMLKYKYISLLKDYGNRSAATDALCYIVLELECIGVINNV
jgi:cell fate regulator YaaT (PSP1 superfamily)